MALEILPLLKIADPGQCKFHAARWNHHEQPLDVFTRSRDEWFGWNSWRGGKDDFNRRFIVSFMDFYPERKTWLFGGGFEVLARGQSGDDGYTIRLCEDSADLIGRLKVKADISRGRAFLLENLYQKLLVSELLKEAYSGEPFVGLENVSLDFSMLETIMRNERLDWKTALQNVKGIYLIADRMTGKKYVGSAYNEVGIWSRWLSYIDTGHGWNVELVKLAGDISYARQHFRITLLETWPFRTEDKVIIARESYWKEALLTRGDFGYNRN